MIPGTTTCPSGWTTQYNGHLLAPHMTYYAAEYMCMDNDIEGLPTLKRALGLLLYSVNPDCTDIPCPPYNKYNRIYCVVCSK